MKKFVLSVFAGVIVATTVVATNAHAEKQGSAHVVSFGGGGNPYPQCDPDVPGDCR